MGIYRPPGGPRCRVISDNDYCGDPDGLVQLVHHLLSPAAEVRAVIGSHMTVAESFMPAGETAAESYRRVLEVLDLMDLRGSIPAYQGSTVPLADTGTPRRSAAAEAIVEEAMRTDTELPLYAVFGAGLTELASAFMMEPRIAERLTAVWIGGNEYPDLAEPPPGVGNLEFNLSIDLRAAQVVFDSDIPLWQVPRDCYRQPVVGMTELDVRMRPMGKIGAYLYESLADVFAKVLEHGMDLGETYILGDSPLVLLTALQSSFHPDTSSSRWVTRHAPKINDDGSYTPRSDGREIRVYTHLDTRLLIDDLFAKLEAAYRR